MAAIQEPSGWMKDRPRIPAGYEMPEGMEGTLDLATVEVLIQACKNYWICTASAEGKPHAIPVWGAYHDGVLYFHGGPRTTRNLAANPRVSIHLEAPDKAVILEGTVAHKHGSDSALAKALDDQFAEKYDWRPSGESDTPVGEGMLTLTPDRIIAWISFPADATRWTRSA